jgi:hypothetical protein
LDHNLQTPLLQKINQKTQPRISENLSMSCV